MRVFCTVGSQLPFDRLIRAVASCAERQPELDVFCQIGIEARFKPQLAHVETLTLAAFDHEVRKSDLVVAHAGMGSILTALVEQKPVLVLPRRAELQEHRNDHQLHTARKLGDLGLVHVAMDEQALGQALANPGKLAGGPSIGPSASPELVCTVQSFIDQ